VANLLAQATGDLAFTQSGRRQPTPKPESDAERERRIDDELMAAGVFPGDPSLYEAPDEAHDSSHDHRSPEPSS
jgi:hypothetical protein